MCSWRVPARRLWGQHVFQQDNVTRARHDRRVLEENGAGGGDDGARTLRVFSAVASARDAGRGPRVRAGRVHGRPPGARRGRRAGAVGPAHVARASGPAHRTADRWRGLAALGRGHGPGAPRARLRRCGGRLGRVARARAPQGARRVRRRARVRVLRLLRAVRPCPRGQRPRHRVRRILRDRAHGRAG